MEADVNWTAFFFEGGMTPIFILLSGVITAAIALRAIASSRRVARCRAAVDLIEKVEYSERYALIMSVFQYQCAKGFDDIINPAHQEDKERRMKVLQYLNHYELVSIGIKSKIVDEAIYKEWMGTALVADWNKAASFIQRERWRYDPNIEKWVYKSSLYEHFGRLARAWSPDAEVLNEKASLPPEMPNAVSDMPIPRLSKTLMMGKL